MEPLARQAETEVKAIAEELPKVDMVSPATFISCKGVKCKTISSSS